MSRPGGWPDDLSGRPPALDEDYHVHSTFSDGASSPAENLAAAESAGLRTICMADHVPGRHGLAAGVRRRYRRA